LNQIQYTASFGLPFFTEHTPETNSFCYVRYLPCLSEIDPLEGRLGTEDAAKFVMSNYFGSTRRHLLQELKYMPTDLNLVKYGIASGIREKCASLRNDKDRWIAMVLLCLKQPDPSEACLSYLLAVPPEAVAPLDLNPESKAFLEQTIASRLDFFSSSKIIQIFHLDTAAILISRIPELSSMLKSSDWFETFDSLSEKHKTRVIKHLFEKVSGEQTWAILQEKSFAKLADSPLVPDRKVDKNELITAILSQGARASREMIQSKAFVICATYGAMDEELGYRSMLYLIDSLALDAMTFFEAALELGSLNIFRSYFLDFRIVQPTEIARRIATETNPALRDVLCQMISELFLHEFYGVANIDKYLDESICSRSLVSETESADEILDEWLWLSPETKSAILCRLGELQVAKEHKHQVPKSARHKSIISRLHSKLKSDKEIVKCDCHDSIPFSSLESMFVYTGTSASTSSSLW
jgi:hypothetical protein